MIGNLRERFGAAGLVVAVIALIAALAGTAFAAAKLNSTQKKEVKNIAKQFAGKNGKNGKDGAPGATGPAGAAGKDGAPGAPGKDGANGKGVTVGTEAALTANCEGRGGAWVQVEGEAASTRKYACTGKTGAPWPAGGTLPSGETETGTWSLYAPPGEIGAGAVSFALPLSNTIPTANVHLLKGSETNANCPGSSSIPAAADGHLCVWVGATENTTVEEVGAPADALVGASRTGAVVFAVGGTPTPTTGGFATGTFAVTAP